MVRLLETIRNAFTKTKPFALQSGQFAFDDNVGFKAYQTFYAALKRNERIWTYNYIHDNVPIVDGAIGILTGLANTPMRADTGDAVLDREVNEVLDYLAIESINPQIDRMLLVYGYSATEWVLSDDLGAIEDLVVLPSLETRFRVDERGRVTKVIQIPRAHIRNTNPVRAGHIEIPTEKCLVMQRNRMGINHHYGRSLFQTAVASIDSLSAIFDCQIKIYRRFGTPRYVLEVDTALADSTEMYADILRATAAEFAKSDSESTNIAGPPGLKASIVGAEGSALRWKDETQLVVSNILAATGIPASLLNFNVGGVTESYSRQQVLVMMAIIRNLQRVKAQQYVRKLMPVLSAVYGFPPIKRLRFDPPRLLEQKLEEDARQVRRANDWADCVDGLISPETFAMRQGIPEVYDLEKLKERLEQQQQPEQPQTDNAEVSTTLSDNRQSSNGGF